MAKMVLACRGEGHWGSREEDGSKVDLVFSCEHPWHPRERMLILGQVKSGKTYGQLEGAGFRLHSKAKAAAIRTSHAICVIWVDRDNNRAFWAYVHPDSTTRGQDYGPHHEISPATLFDLARCVSRRKRGAFGGGGVIVRRRDSALLERRKRLYDIYRQIGTVPSPVLGFVEMTRTGWRHMFRSSRSRRYKQTSLDLIPHLKKLIAQEPSGHAITANESFCAKGYTYCVREHLLRFDQIKVVSLEGSEGLLASAILKFKEEIRFPENWQSSAMLTQMVERRVVLQSAYYKIKK